MLSASTVTVALVNQPKSSISLKQTILGYGRRCRCRRNSRTLRRLMSKGGLPDCTATPSGLTRVLLITGDTAGYESIDRVMQSIGTELIVSTSVRSGIESAVQLSPDLILLDQPFTEATCAEVLLRLRLHACLAETPILVITTSVDRERLQAWFDAGATDYVGRPLLAAELRARVRVLIRHRWLSEELIRIVNTDAVTGLPNRRMIQDRLQQAIERSIADPDAAFALLLIDFDRFRLVNDSLGPAIGDLLLNEIARRLRNNVRGDDLTGRETESSTVARLGGDEFLVLLHDVPDAQAAASAAERLIDVIQQPFHLGNHTIRSSASIGIVHSSGGYTLAADMLRDASVALYEAKGRGRGCHVEYVQPLGTAVRSRLELENALREAIGTDEMFLVYQPILSLEDRHLESVEALLRWKPAGRSFIPPSDFIPIAEETRLILPLSEIVLRQACEQFMKWRREMPERAPRYISVNLSRVQLTDEQLVAKTMNILQEIGMPPACLQLEVTESQIMQQKSLAVDLLGQIRKYGVRLAMDDFGTGYSSLACLQEYPFDVLKVDRALTSHIGRGRGYTALLQAIILLADNLGLDVVAEGIERSEQLALLQALGYSFGQGFLLGRPMLADALATSWNQGFQLQEAV